jgi:uncharacterized tellurite resistance protein B-like protein
MAVIFLDGSVLLLMFGFPVVAGITLCAMLVLVVFNLVCSGKTTIAISNDYKLHHVVESPLRVRHRIFDLRDVTNCYVDSYEALRFNADHTIYCTRFVAKVVTEQEHDLLSLDEAPQPVEELVDRVNAWILRMRISPYVDAMCCVMAADGKVSSGERTAVLRWFLKWDVRLTPEVVDEQISEFVARVNASGFRQVVDETVARLKAVAFDCRNRSAFHAALLALAKTDGAVARNEQLVINKLMAALEEGKTTAKDGVHHVT